MAMFQPLRADIRTGVTRFSWAHPQTTHYFPETYGPDRRCHDSFPEPEYKQLCLSVVSVHRRFHFVQVVYCDHLS